MTDKKEASANRRQPSGKLSTPKPTRVDASMTKSKEQPPKKEATIVPVSVRGKPDSSSTTKEEVSSPEISKSSKLTTSSTPENPPTPSPTAKTAESAAIPSSNPRRTLDVFLVDSGWNNDVAKAVRENLPIFSGYLQGQRFYVLSKAQSLEFIKRHPALVGADPILIVLDREAAEQKKTKGYGFRLCLGYMRNPEAAISMLKWAIQLSMAANGTEMATIVKESGHRQTIQGTIELIGEGSAHLLEFAPV